MADQVFTVAAEEPDEAQIMTLATPPKSPPNVTFFNEAGEGYDVMRFDAIADDEESPEAAESKAEAGRVFMLESLFDACDDDGSGALSFSEFGQLFDEVDEETKAMFNEVDMETFEMADQKLTKAEFVAFHTRKFAPLDDDTFETVVSQLLAKAEDAEVIDDEAAVVAGEKAKSERPRRSFAESSVEPEGTSATIAALLEGAGAPGWKPKPVPPTVVAVLGPPGSGRSTHCASIASLLNGTALNASDAMSAAVSVGTPVGEKIALVLSQGKAITLSLIHI